MLDAQGLGDAKRKKMKDLSKGMAQKVQLIASVVHRPEFVILDEPFSGLDPVNQQGLETVIRQLAADGATVLFSTHVMQHAERLCGQGRAAGAGQEGLRGLGG
jgi:ABC-2 type transport system ATP-binding protein